MNFEPHASALVRSARQALEVANSIPEIKNARRLAKLARDCAYSANVPRQTLFRAACLWIRAEHKLGRTLATTELAKAAPGNQYTGKKTLDRSHEVGGPHYLRDLGLTEMQSYRAQLLAVFSEAELDQWLSQQCSAGIEPTLKAIRDLAKSKKLQVKQQRSGVARET